MKRPLIWSGLALLLAAGPVVAGELGIPAPPLQIASWVKGTPVQPTLKNSSNTIHVVEFWATWCGPCRKTIPYLTKLQQQFKDRGVRIIGISSETLPEIKPFVQRMGSQMDYAVAADADKATSIAYYELYGERGIPHAYVVDPQGRIAWQGHPMAGLDNVLEDLLAGTYSIEGANRAQRAEPDMQRYFEKAAAGVVADSIRPAGEKILEEIKTSTDALNRFAWVIAQHPRIQTRDLDLALRAAKAAYERSKGKNAFSADTYAGVLFKSGKIQEAVDAQTKAVAAARPEDREAMERALDTYRAALK